MKNSIVFTMMIVLLIFFPGEASSQGVKVDVKGKVIQQADSRANQRTDQAISYGFDKLEQSIAEGVNNILKKKDNHTGSGESEVQPEESSVAATTTTNEETAQQPAADIPQEQATLKWNKFDFVPGDEVIFEDNLQGEENGEFPSRWDLVRGNVEIAEFGGEKVIMLRDGYPTIVPYFKNPGEDYLPEVFTVELDLYYPGSGRFEIYLYDSKNQTTDKSPNNTCLSFEHFYTYLMTFGDSRSNYPDNSLENKRWNHISVAYTNGKLKAYLDDTRLINIPRIEFNPSGLTLFPYGSSNENIFYVKNVRIAKGGVKYYDRVMQDGKIIISGIRFDTGKSTLKPESMGPINEIYNLMKNNPDLKFSVEGHTDSDGDDAFNQTLSEERAQVVMKTLMQMGISSERLTSKGWGESKPISNNASPEDKANNRRVEFVKK